MAQRVRIIGIALVFCFGFAVFLFAAPQTTMSVQVKEGQVRSSASFLGPIVARLAYGERVEIVQDRGSWLKVALRSGLQGWMHASALTAKKIVLKAGTGDVQTSATSGEIALAGKGFSEEVEREYKQRNRALDYAWVDRMERFQVSPEQMQAFLKEGNVVPAEGGGR
ncbi:MAG: SH3 domain-containing protein [Syntrophales bacterium]